MFFRVFDRKQTENYLSSCSCMTLFLICHMFLRGILCLPVSVIASPLLASSILPFLLFSASSGTHSANTMFLRRTCDFHFVPFLTLSIRADSTPSHCVQ